MIRRRNARTVFLFALFCAVTGALIWALPPAAAMAGDDERVRVGYHFAPGSSEQYKFEFNQEYEVRGYAFYTLIDLEYTETCIEAENDTLFTMEITVDKVSAQMKRNDDLMDSGLDEDMKGQTFRFLINKNGMISGIQAKGYIESEDEVMQIMQVVFSGGYPYLPDSTMGVGDEWTFEGSTIRDQKSDIEVESDAAFKIEEFKKEKDRRCALIKREGDRYISGRVENQGGVFALDGQGEGKAEYFFDISNGIIIKLKSESTAEITYVDASGGSAGEREAQTTNMSYNLKKEIK